MKYTKLDGEIKNYDKFIKDFLENLQNLADEEDRKESDENRMTVASAGK